MKHDLDLVALAATYTIAGQEYAEALNLKALQRDGKSSRVMLARMMTMRATIVATGTISVFESVLQQTLGWRDAFTQLDAHLRTVEQAELADRLLDYRCAVNVLKHGAGRSHDRLLERQAALAFAVRPVEQPFHDEGDMSEVGTLVRADVAFVNQCAHVVEEVTSVLRRTIPDAPL